MNGLLQIIFVSYTYTRIPMDAVEALVESVSQAHSNHEKSMKEHMNALRLENERLKAENRQITMELTELRSSLQKTRVPSESLMSDIDIEDVKKIMDAQIRHMLVQRINAEL
jgi:cell shape-determining protein MreC